MRNLAVNFANLEKKSQILSALDFGKIPVLARSQTDVHLNVVKRKFPNTETTFGCTFV